MSNTAQHKQLINLSQLKLKLEHNENKKSSVSILEKPK